MDLTSFVTVEQAADLLGVSPQTIRDWTRAGVIPKSAYFKVGRVLRLDREATALALVAYQEPKSEPQQLDMFQE